MPISTIPTALLTRLVLLAAMLVGTAHGAAQPVTAVQVDKGSFNPGAGESVTLGFRLEQPAAARIQVYDPDGGLIRTLPVPAGPDGSDQRVTWDGRDDSGKAVPDEAYTFVIETAAGAVYDPTTFSGGEVADLTDLTFGDSGAVGYRLPAPARVLIRLGVHNGPMYRTLVDWKPRPAGSVTEQWDGFDLDQLVRLRGHKDLSALVTYATLPAATVIAYGNAAETYRAYKLGRGKDRPVKPERPPAADATQRFRPESLVPPAWARAPDVTLSFPDFPAPDAVPTAKRTVAVRIEVASEDKPRLMGDQFEVLLFVDSQFFAEAERGYLPLNWTWELAQFPPGEHILTVNISSFRGQVGVASRKVLVEK